VRAAFDAQIRRNTRAGEPGTVVEADAGVLRWLAPGTQTSRITWSELTSGSADAVIAAQVRYFAARGTPVEWCSYMASGLHLHGGIHLCHDWKTMPT